MIEYFGKMTKFWDDLTNYDKTVMCKCGGCTCNIAADLEKKRDEDKVHQFLLGLDEDVYRAVRASIISTDPMPSMNQVYSKIKSVERVNTMMRGREQQGAKTTFAVRASGFGKEEKNMFYTVCKKTGHGPDTCFRLGIPSDGENKSAKLEEVVEEEEDEVVEE